MCRRTCHSYAAPPMAGVNMLNNQQQQPTSYIPVANCPHKHNRACKHCRRGYGHANYGFPPVVAMAAGPSGGCCRRQRRGRRNGPISALIGVIVSAVQKRNASNKQQQLGSGGVRDMSVEEPMNEKPREHGVEQRAPEVVEAPPRYSFTEDRRPMKEQVKERY